MSSELSVILDKIFQENGILESQDPTIKYRPSQHRMAQEVLKSLESGTFSLIDAPTGIGKSLAYLIPCMLFSAYNGTKIVVATDTNALLFQLYTKDAPFAQNVVNKAYDINCKFAYIQGKSRYLCYRRYEYYLQSCDTGLFDTSGLSDSDYKYLKKFHDISKYAQADDIDSSHTKILKIWNSINISDDFSCKDCPYKMNNCRYYSQLQKRVFASDVIITNHSLLLSDAQIRKQDSAVIGSSAWSESVILPSYGKLVIDEAHNLVRNCENAFNLTYSTKDMSLCITHIISKENNLFISLLHASQNANSETYNSDIALSLSANLEVLLKLNKRLEDILSAAFFKSGDIKECLIDFVKSFDLEDVTNEIVHIASSVHTTFTSVKRVSSNANIYDDILGFVNKIKTNAEALDSTVNKKLLFSSPTLHQVERVSGQNSSYYILKSTPLFAGEHLGELLYDNLESCIFTSATLSTGNDFGFYKRTAGLDYFDSDRISSTALESVFDWKNNVVQIYTTDINTQIRDSISFDRTAELIFNAIKYSKGGALVLFTSFSALNEVFSRIKKFEKDLGFEILAQGAGESNSVLIKKFREDKNSTLFATSSFWEGVDFSGDTLRLLVVHKLPFSVPSTPIHVARNNALIEKNRSLFDEYDIPEVVIKMRQGYGRLMRKETDKGVIILLDNRVVLKPQFKKNIFSHLDKGNSHIVTSQEAIDIIKGFFG